MGNVVVRGLNNFIFFNAYFFLSVNVFQGEGVVKFCCHWDNVAVPTQGKLLFTVLSF